MKIAFKMLDDSYTPVQNTCKRVIKNLCAFARVSRTRFLLPSLEKREQQLYCTRKRIKKMFFHSFTHFLNRLLLHCVNMVFVTAY
jgi:hypothetical protein